MVRTRFVRVAVDAVSGAVEVRDACRRCLASDADYVGKPCSHEVRVGGQSTRLTARTVFAGTVLGTLDTLPNIA